MMSSAVGEESLIPVHGVDQCFHTVKGHLTCKKNLYHIPNLGSVPQRVEEESWGGIGWLRLA